MTGSPASPRGCAPSDDYSIELLDARIARDCLVLEYSISPVPAELVGDRERHIGTGAGIAVDSRHHSCGESRSAYRVTEDGQEVRGVLRVGPTEWPTLARLRVLFAPLAYTPGLARRLSEVRVTIDAHRVRGAHVVADHGTNR